LQIVPCFLIASWPSVHRLSYLRFFPSSYRAHRDLHSFPTRRSSDLSPTTSSSSSCTPPTSWWATTSRSVARRPATSASSPNSVRSEEHTSELQSRENLVCRLLLEKKKFNTTPLELPRPRLTK